MSLQRQVCQNKRKINKVGVGTQLFIFQALMFYCVADKARYTDYRLFLFRSLPFSISNVGLSIACKIGRPHHISPRSGGKIMHYLSI
jgi:hypothetical protein